MDERKLQKLRDVLVERLSSGEDPTVLRDHLVRELSPDQAERLIAEARDRVDAGRGDPVFARSVDEIRKRRETGAHRRPPVALDKPSLRVTAGMFGGIGVLLLISSISQGRPDLSPFVAGLLFAVPAAALWRSNSLIAAGALMGICGLACAASAIFAVNASRSFGLAPFSIVVIWLILLAVAVRAFLIVRAARLRSAASPRLAGVFE
ncbi:hypothetical protein [Brevundimonas sp.]|uniref:hypothetical protein n=1 Tax=Brevundimonas sp. TaxID=1871086 RepID=UPI002D32CB02|nr:hypothetical protein [Brevundimonas sp.]HYC97226.1 hypothetical protein [Brevundimonas sp.]